MSQNVIGSILFRYYSPEEIKNICPVEVRLAHGLDGTNRPVPNGLYDEHMGPIHEASFCQHCNLDNKNCPGHFGFYEFSYPFFNPMTRVRLKSVLNICCVFCQRMCVSPYTTFLLRKVLDLLDAGCTKYAVELQVKLQEKKNNKKTVDRKAIRKRVKKVIKKRMESQGFDNKNKFLRAQSFKTEVHILELKKEIVENFLKAALAVSTCQQCGCPKLKFVVEKKRIFALNGLKKDERSKAVEELKKFKGSRKSYFVEIENECKKERNWKKRKTYEIHPFRLFKYLTLLCKKEHQTINYIYQITGDRKKLRFSNCCFLEVLPISSNKFRQLDRLHGEDVMDGTTKFIQQLVKTDFDIKEMKFAYEKEKKDRKKKKKMNDEEEDDDEEEEEEDDEEEEEEEEEEMEDEDKELKDVDSDLWDFLQSNNMMTQTKSVQGYINMFYGAEDASLYKQSSFGGIKSEIDKKEGMMRLYMMGKRVNYSARSVILPDPCVLPSELAIPLFYATSLTYPERVTFHNIDRLRTAVMNGPKRYPGANFLVDRKGFKLDLSNHSKESRRSLANTLISKEYQVVHRHLIDGDTCLMNRQPTLHRPSILAHKVRVIPVKHKSLRFHYANCQSYNADFDGDEMNLHVPQSVMARAEAEELLQAHNQYCSPTSGAPIRGLIQDDIVSGVLLTKKDTFLTKDEYQQLVYAGLHHLENYHIRSLPPAVLKPQVLYTGKQVISTILKNLSLYHSRSLGWNEGLSIRDSPCKIKGDMFWGKGHEEEENLNLVDGELLTGVLDKNHIGPRKYGMVHCFHTIYGGRLTDLLLSSLSRTFMTFLHHYGVSCRFNDFNLKKKVKRRMRKKLERLDHKLCRRSVESFSKKMNNLSVQEILKDDIHHKRMEFVVKKLLNTESSKCMEIAFGGMKTQFPYNFLTLMTGSGAKGSQVNVSQICCCLGQQYFEGKRVHVEKKTGQTLPSFEPFSTRAQAGGYVSNRFLDGIDPQEYFYHCQAGRDGLIDTAVKTSKSGYLQRSLVKALEVLTSHYDQSVRDCYGSVVQFRYGGDGILVSDSSMLKRFDFFCENFDHLCDTPTLYEARYSYDEFPKYYDREVRDFLGRRDVQERLNEKGIPPKSLYYFLKDRFCDSYVCGGEPVGILAAQGVGEPSTQMTLNTFHFAGVEDVHVTQGIPRLRSVMMSGSESTKVLKVPFFPMMNKKGVELVKTKLGSLKLSELFTKVKAKEKLIQKEDNEVWAGLVIQIGLDMKEAREYGVGKEDIFLYLKYFWDVFRTRVLQSKKISKKAYTLKTTKRQKKLIKESLGRTIKQQFGDLYSSELFGIREDDEDSQEDQEEDQEEEEEESVNEESEEDKNVEEEEEDEEEDEDEDEEEEEEEEDKKKEEEEEYSNEDIIVDGEDGGFRLDFKKCQLELSLEIPSYEHPDIIALIKDLTSQINIRKVENIDRVTIHRKNEETILVTEGEGRGTSVNFRSIFQLCRVLDCDKLETNDITSFTIEYGVEGGRALCEEELVKVFQSHGVEVNVRHLRLIADYMFFRGRYRPCNRHSKRGLPGVINRASFETSTNFFRDGALWNELDPISDCSSQIVVGKLVNAGTGSFDVFHQPLQHFQNYKNHQNQ